jgi:hypothetical protein
MANIGVLLAERTPQDDRPAARLLVKPSLRERLATSRSSIVILLLMLAAWATVYGVVYLLTAITRSKPCGGIAVLREPGLGGGNRLKGVRSARCTRPADPTSLRELLGQRHSQIPGLAR